MWSHYTDHLSRPSRLQPSNWYATNALGQSDQASHLYFL